MILGGSVEPWIVSSVIFEEYPDSKSNSATKTTKYMITKIVFEVVASSTTARNVKNTP